MIFNYSHLLIIFTLVEFLTIAGSASEIDHKPNPINFLVSYL